MTEVLILGVLVALVKLAHIAGVVPGIALWAFGALMLLLAAISAAFDPREFWERMAPATSGGAPRAGADTSRLRRTPPRAPVFSPVTNAGCCRKRRRTPTTRAARAAARICTFASPRASPARGRS